MTDKQKKAFDNVASRGQLDTAKAEAGAIRNAVNQLEADLFEALAARVRDLSALVTHLEESLTTLKDARALRGG